MLTDIEKQQMEEQVDGKRVLSANDIAEALKQAIDRKDAEIEQFNTDTLDQAAVLQITKKF